MKVVVLRSRKSEAPKKDRYLQEFDTLYAERVISNLRNDPGFCNVCESDCISCRKEHNRSFSRDIAAVIDFPAVMPYVLENPATYVPENVPAHDILLVINIHEQILLEILKKCKDWHTKGVVVPLEASDWISGAARAEAHKICELNNIEISFPKPFCSFNPPKGGVLAEFREYFKIGFPDVKLDVQNDIITKAHVNVSAACGATYYVAKWLEGRKLEENIEIEVIAKRLHSYPCTAGMERDPELNDDTPMHIAGQAHYAILSPFKKAAAENDNLVLSPLGKMVQKPIPARENLDNIEKAEKLILAELKEYPAITLEQLRKTTKSTPAAINSALILLKKEGKLRVEGNKILRAKT